jgi:hypothetical protein
MLLDSVTGVYVFSNLANHGTNRGEWQPGLSCISSICEKSCDPKGRLAAEPSTKGDFRIIHPTNRTDRTDQTDRTDGRKDRKDRTNGSDGWIGRTDGWLPWGCAHHWFICGSLRC